MLMVNIYAPADGRKKKMNLDTIKRFIGARIDTLPLRDKLVTVPFNMDYPYWVEDQDFSLDRHIFDSSLNPPPQLGPVSQYPAKPVGNVTRSLQANVGNAPCHGAWPSQRITIRHLRAHSQSAPCSI